MKIDIFFEAHFTCRKFLFVSSEFQYHAKRGVGNFDLGTVDLKFLLLKLSTFVSKIYGL
jgi:hypothetical protein